MVLLPISTCKDNRFSTNYAKIMIGFIWVSDKFRAVLLPLSQNHGRVATTRIKKRKILFLRFYPPYICIRNQKQNPNDSITIQKNIRL